MPAVKKYTRINFQNYPSTSTPLNATNLNKMDKGIDDLDDEVVAVKNTIENMSFNANSISYDNTSSGLQATDVQGAVDEINDNLTELTANKIGATVNISSYSSSFYEFPTDGYVTFRWYTSDATGYTEVYGNNEVNSVTLSRNGDTTQGTLPLFVKKGMKAKSTNMNNAKNECFFKPIE